MRAIIRVSDGLDWLLRRLAAGCFVGMLVFVSIQVVARYILREPPTWTEELARFAMVWGGLLGATVAYKSQYDPVLIRLSDRNSAFLRWAMRLIRLAAPPIFLGPVLYFSIFGPNMDMARGFLGRSALRTADTLGFPMIYIALAVPIAACAILIHWLARFGEEATGDDPSID
ncbi:TRAP transporter small permease [Oceanibacterium hippocampi]|uniref:TRAP transporter small permease protein n=1 Tax=Oceanibacterium hippocampi TaxID=745714 RepID=A0A1Y5TS14_9PROT|nr:TRAP transporter small permease subunit [Oceanibacterium hippocampi]SLN70114.1 Tripartite ATP-independent periplasmic transporters, DctQ component [Oceanibacterium hippocampi]